LKNVLYKNPLDDDEPVGVRCAKLAAMGVVSLFVQILKDVDSKAKSANLNSAIAETLLYLATSSKNRGKMVQDGAMKALLILSEDQSDAIKTVTAHCIAKICISVDPHVAFKEGTVSRLVSPLMSLLKSEVRISDVHFRSD
jgi:hypothetical protein